MAKILDILMILILILFVISVLMMPWPANIVIGALLLLTVIVSFAHERRAKKNS